MRAVAATPETVHLSLMGLLFILILVLLNLFHHDDDYVAAGAELLTDTEDPFKRADVILKVKEPLFNDKLGKHEVDMMYEGQVLITFIHPASPVNHEMKASWRVKV